MTIVLREVEIDPSGGCRAVAELGGAEVPVALRPMPGGAPWDVARGQAFMERLLGWAWDQRRPLSRELLERLEVARELRARRGEPLDAPLGLFEALRAESIAIDLRGDRQVRVHVEVDGGAPLGGIPLEVALDPGGGRVAGVYLLPSAVSLAAALDVAPPTLPLGDGAGVLSAEDIAAALAESETFYAGLPQDDGETAEIEVYWFNPDAWPPARVREMLARVAAGLPALRAFAALACYASAAEFDSEELIAPPSLAAFEAAHVPLNVVLIGDDVCVVFVTSSLRGDGFNDYSWVTVDPGTWRVTGAETRSTPG
ncbi:MAG: hypothetical protein H6745_20610 [Deltaproteobacteria bacterium]|nr:hypothetical protein [Deltaproteobacteria bacterium]